MLFDILSARLKCVGDDWNIPFTVPAPTGDEYIANNRLSCKLVSTERRMER